MKKRILAMILIVVLVLSMSGCGADSDSKKLVGTWRCEKDMTRIMEQIVFGDDAEGAARYLELTDISFTCYMEFRSDGTYQMYADEDSLRDMFDSLVDDFMKALEAYLSDMFYEQTGVTLNLEEILELTGVTMDELLATLDVDTIIEETLKETNREGKYAAEEGKLFTSLGLEYDVDPEIYEIYTLDGKTMTITGCVGMDMGEMEYYPMVFEKIG